MAVPHERNAAGSHVYARELRILTDKIADCVDVGLPLLGRRNVVVELLVVAMARCADLAAEQARERVAGAAERFLVKNGTP